MEERNEPSQSTIEKRMERGSWFCGVGRERTTRKGTTGRRDRKTGETAGRRNRSAHLEGGRRFSLGEEEKSAADLVIIRKPRFPAVGRREREAGW